MTDAEKAYNFPETPRPEFLEGPANLWVTPQGELTDVLKTMVDNFHNVVKLGDEAPDFTGQLVDGTSLTLSDYREDKIVVLILGCLSDPPIGSNMRATEPSLHSLYRKYESHGVEFVFVYTREAIPGNKMPPHTTIEEKTDRARRLVEREGALYPMVVDALDGPIHKAYGLLHNSVFIINRKGRTVSKLMFLDSATVDHAIAEALVWDRLDDGKRVVKKGFYETINVCRAPYDPGSRRAEIEAISAAGDGILDAIPQMFGFDPNTWRAV